LVAAIKGQHPDAKVALIKGGSGDFIVIADGQELWHKRQMGDEFPENQVILDKLEEL
jgi:predicted Rdx family selenoprotein